MYFLYLLYNIETEKYYVGFTSNINKRLKEHQSGLNQFTKYKCCAWKLIYTEIYKAKQDAIIRENKLKTHGSGLVEIKKRILHSLKLIKLKTGEGKR